MPLFQMNGAEPSESQTAKRPRAEDGSGVQTGGEDLLDVTERLARLETRQNQQGRILVVHDTRLRELGALFRVLHFLKAHRYYTVLHTVEVKWKETAKAYYTDKKDSGTARKIGNKHLLLASKLLEAFHSEGETNSQVKQAMSARWEGKNTSNPDFLGTDIKLMKWRETRDGKGGALEFKLTETLAPVEEEIIRVMVKLGAVELQGPAPKGTMIRAEEELLEGSWTRR